ncbi:hypothetical protein GXW82_34975 [Streptacidiphilus sp. 4-A2]|nr:hypothetical protein [Streptacidiphilus sp. 4-A2]
MIPLHPLSLSDIINGIFGTLRHHFWAIYGPLALMVLGSGVVTAIGAAASYSPLHNLYRSVQQQNSITDHQVAELFAFILGGALLIMTLDPLLAP